MWKKRGVEKKYLSVHPKKYVQLNLCNPNATNT